MMVALALIVQIDISPAIASLVKASIGILLITLMLLEKMNFADCKDLFIASRLYFSRIFNVTSPSLF
jgi:hypothetical protein